MHFLCCRRVRQAGSSSRETGCQLSVKEKVMPGWGGTSSEVEHRGWRVGAGTLLLACRTEKVQRCALLLWQPLLLTRRIQSSRRWYRTWLLCPSLCLPSHPDSRSHRNRDELTNHPCLQTGRGSREKSVTSAGDGANDKNGSRPFQANCRAQSARESAAETHRRMLHGRFARPGHFEPAPAPRQRLPG